MKIFFIFVIMSFFNLSFAAGESASGLGEDTKQAVASTTTDCCETCDKKASNMQVCSDRSIRDTSVQGVSGQGNSSGVSAQ